MSSDPAPSLPEAQELRVRARTLGQLANRLVGTSPRYINQILCDEIVLTLRDGEKWLLQAVEALAAVRAPEAHKGYDFAKVQVQRLYNLTTWLISESPTGRLDEGATRGYHDALVSITNLRDELRRGPLVEHDEDYWHLGNKPLAGAPEAEPQEQP